MSDVPARSSRRPSVVAVAQGALLGAAVTLAVVLAWSALAQPAQFKSSVVPVPSAVAVPPTATPFVRTDVPLVLEPDGIGMARFGDPGGHIVEMLTGSLGLPNEDATIPCSGPVAEMRAVRWGDLTLFLSEDAFVGYIDTMYYPNDAPALAPKTAEGVGIHTTRADLVAAYRDRVTFADVPDMGPNDAVEYRIDRGELNGLLEGAGEDGVVITVRAGQGCFETSP